MTKPAGSASASAALAKPADDSIVINLKEPALAAFLAWLIPGAGHLYQGRTAKGLLFMICILGTFLYGLFIGEGRVVYASWRPEDRRYPYLCQVGAGLPALPALVQAVRARYNKPPLFADFMRPPDYTANHDELSEWHRHLNRRFELGTVYTMIAGLLNILVIYDAWGGPVQVEADDKKGKEPEEKPPSTA